MNPRGQFSMGKTMDEGYRLPGWDGPHTGPSEGGNTAMITAAYNRHDTLTPERILQIARNAARCQSQRVMMKGYEPTQALQYHLDLGRRLLLVFPKREDRERHPVRIYTHGQMTIGEKNGFIASIVEGFVENLRLLEGPGKERASLSCVK